MSRQRFLLSLDVLAAAVLLIVSAAAFGPQATKVERLPRELT